MKQKFVLLDPDELEQHIEVAVLRALDARKRHVEDLLDKRLVVKSRLTADEAADYLGIARKTFNDWRSKYEIPCKKVGQQLYFKPEDLDRFIDRNSG